jgi:eukaryotic-like serine/threonine-protein kinase
LLDPALRMDEYLNLRFRQVIQSQSAAYTCLQRLGVGGTAETYLMLASAGSLRGQLFAVKIFRRISKPDWRQNFLDEIEFLQRCSHPAVMRVFDEGLYLDEHPFVVAEYLPDTLGNVLRTAQPMMTKMAYAVQLLSALEYLSNLETPVLHRDIKPTNVFIKGGSCVLGDFGLMKRVAVNRELDQEMLKSSVGPRMPRNYRTPDLVEYFKGGPVPTEKSDIYQLGLLFVEMFSGTNPQLPMTTGDFADPIELRSFFIEGGLGKPLKDLIMPMLEADPANRPAAAKLIVLWQGLFLDAASRSHALEGRVF